MRIRVNDRGLNRKVKILDGLSGSSELLEHPFQLGPMMCEVLIVGPNGSEILVLPHGQVVRVAGYWLARPKARKYAFSGACNFLQVFPGTAALNGHQQSLRESTAV